MRTQRRCIITLATDLDKQIWLPGYNALQKTVDRGGSLREIIQAGLRPYKQAVLDFPWGGDAQSFLFHLGESGGEKALAAFEATRSKHDALYKRSVHAAVPHLSKAVFEQRWQFMMTEAIAGQFVRAKLLHTGIEASNKWSPQQERTYLKCYLDYVVGGLKATVTS